MTETEKKFHEAVKQTQTKIIPGEFCLRDYFAAAALQGLLADQTVCADADESQEEFSKSLCRSCYEYADDMLEARQK